MQLSHKTSVNDISIIVMLYAVMLSSLPISLKAKASGRLIGVGGAAGWGPYALYVCAIRMEVV